MPSLENWGGGLKSLVTSFVLRNIHSAVCSSDVIVTESIYSLMCDACRSPCALDVRLITSVTMETLWSCVDCAVTKEM